MTNEEAINQLEYIIGDVYIPTVKQIKALEMAIEALKAVPIMEKEAKEIADEAYEKGKADAQKSGEWIDITRIWLGHCSECNKGGAVGRYCMWCGAKMKGGDGE